MKYDIKVLGFLLITLLAASCSKKKDAYNVSDSGLEYKYRQESKSGVYPQHGDKMLLRIMFYNAKDSLMFDSREISSRFIMEFSKPRESAAGIDDAYAMMQEGDSISFRINAYDFYYKADKQSPMLSKVTRDEKLRFEIRLVKIYSEEDFAEDSKKILEELCEQERVLLEDYIKTQHPTVTPRASGLYFIPTKQGSGAKPTLHSEVVIHYIAKYINGEQIYSTYKKIDPLHFNVNDEQVWPCLAESVQLMQKGSKAICIAPSAIAAGESGDSQIPPCKTIVFELELVDFKN